MASYKGIVALIVLCTILTVFGQISHGGPHGSQSDPQPGQHGPEDAIPDMKHANWTTCDITTSPVISCHDCTTRMICKPIGGLLKSCYDPMKPHCNGGICSAVPSAECA